MSGVFGTKGTVNNPTPPESALRIQNSAQGAVIPLTCGTNRVAGNLIWYGGLIPSPVWQPSASTGGKGGGGGSTGTVTYTYSAYLAIAVASGPIGGFLSIFDQRGGQNDPSVFGLIPFLGDYAQAPWGYISTNFPAEALNYRGLGYAAFGPLQLGSTPDLPNLTFEIVGTINGSGFGSPDADPRDWIAYLLTDVHQGIGFPSACLGANDSFSRYCRSTGLLFSQAITTQQSGQRILADHAQATNSDFRWSNGILEIIPYGDQPIGTYLPNTTPVFDLVDDDYLPNQGGSSSADSNEPIQISRLPRADVINIVTVEYLDRSGSYNPVAIDAKDEAAIEVYGKIPSGLRTFHQFSTEAAASMSASLQLNREQVVAIYTVTLGPWAILADVMDLLTATRSPMGLFRQGIRIEEIQENDDGSITFTAEEYLGTASAPAYGRQATAGYSRNLSEDPGSINPPILFEPTAELLGGVTLQIWGAISGADLSKWGGFNVYASFDGGQNYSHIQPSQLGASRMGVLSAQLDPVPVNPTGPTIETDNDLSVDLTESAGALLSASQADVTNLATACYVDGEIIAYRDATLTAANKYDLGYLVRGAFGTESAIVTHPAGSAFARLDQGIFKASFDQSMIGSTIYFKFQSMNVFGGGLQDLAELPAYPYVITGVALKSPLPVVQNVRTQFTDLFEYIYWDDVTDFRTGIRYQIFKGPTFVGAQQVGDNAHAPFIAFGAGTYWIRAYAQPVPGLYVYSENPVSITISGNMLIANLVFQSDQKAEGWPGTFSNGVARDGANIRLGGGGNILADTDILNTPDINNYGGVAASGTYEIPSTEIIDVGYTANCYVNATWIGTGAPTDQNILALDQILDQADILGSASTQFINVKVQIATAIGGLGDLYQDGDLHAAGDLYHAGIAWSAWQDYVPGVYSARWIKFRLLLTSIDPNTAAFALAFSFAVSVPPRIDHYPPQTVPSGGLTITFEPDNASTPAAFNGGPPVGGTIHNQPKPFINVAWPGNPSVNPVYDSLTLSALTFHFEDASGTHITVANVSVTAEGY